MQSKAPIQVDGTIVLSRLRHSNRRPHRVIEFFGKRHHNVQTIRSSALEDHNENFRFIAPLRCRTKQPRWRRANASQRDCRRSKKITSCKHGYLLWKSGELMTKVVSSDGVASFSRMPFSIAVSVAGEGAILRSPVATLVGSLKLKRLMSTITPGTCPPANAVAKLIRPRRLAEFVQASPVFG